MFYGSNWLALGATGAGATIVPQTAGEAVYRSPLDPMLQPPPTRVAVPFGGAGTLWLAGPLVTSYQPSIVLPMQFFRHFEPNAQLIAGVPAGPTDMPRVGTRHPAWWRIP